MGNEESTLSECSTPLSDYYDYQDYQSNYSVNTDNKPGSSRHSTRAPSPMEPPEPDLSHLTAEEIAQIKAVMDRAKDMQTAEQSRVRQLEEDYIEYATRIEREASLTDISEQGFLKCPICNKETICDAVDVNKPPCELNKTGTNLCVDCENLTCSKCGKFSISLTTKMQEWVCDVCERRRKLLMTSGLWYHGSHPETDLPLEKELIVPPTSSSQTISRHSPSTSKERSPVRPDQGVVIPDLTSRVSPNLQTAEQSNNKRSPKHDSNVLVESDQSKIKSVPKDTSANASFVDLSKSKTTSKDKSSNVPFVDLSKSKSPKETLSNIPFVVLSKQKSSSKDTSSNIPFVDLSKTKNASKEQPPIISKSKSSTKDSTNMPIVDVAKSKGPAKDTTLDANVVDISKSKITPDSSPKVDKSTRKYDSKDQPKTQTKAGSMGQAQSSLHPIGPVQPQTIDSVNAQSTSRGASKSPSKSLEATEPQSAIQPKSQKRSSSVPCVPFKHVKSPKAPKQDVPQPSVSPKHQPVIDPKKDPSVVIESDIPGASFLNFNQEPPSLVTQSKDVKGSSDKSPSRKTKPEVSNKPPPPIPPPKPAKTIGRQTSSDSESGKMATQDDKPKKSSRTHEAKSTEKHKSDEVTTSAKGPTPIVPLKGPRGFPNGKPKLFPGPIVHQRLEPMDAQGNKIDKKSKEDRKSKRTERLSRSSSSETPPSRMKGTGSKSDSDDFSDLASDLDMEEIFGERYRADGASTDEAWDDMSISTVSNEETDGGSFRRKYRPKSLNLSRSHSLTSSDEEEMSEGAQAQASAVTNQNYEVQVKAKQPPPVAKKPLTKPPPVTIVSVKEPTESHESSSLSSSSLDIECKAINSPTPPRSPSWREGIESPPFSPKRKDNYPGKRRSGSPGSRSDEEKRHHFNYSDLSPPSRQLSVDELYGDNQGPIIDSTPPLISMAQKPSPISPDEIPPVMTTSGEPFTFTMPPRDKFKTGLSFPPTQKPIEDIHDQVQVMDLATYAATIASSTASLTSMSVSPTNLQVHPSRYDGESVSPDSQESAESTSPVSPGYYDNVSNQGELEEVELADPSTKSIDYQGSKRQKARPPTTDWSPVIDLSPILDVSPSIEEAEHADMLAKQREEFERQKSREEEIERAELAMAEQDEEEDEEVVTPPSKPEEPPAQPVPDQYTFRSLRRYGNFEDMSKIGDNGLTLSTLSDELNGNDPNYHIEDAPPMDEFAMMHCVSLAQPTPAEQSGAHYSSSPIFHNTEGENGAHHKSVMETITSIEIRKISQDLEEIARKGVAEFKPLPPPKPRRKLPEPATESVVKKTPPLVAPKPTIAPAIPREQTATIVEITDEPKAEPKPKLQKQDSFEKKTAKYLKARPNPILVEYIESEEQSVSPQYKVMDSPPTPGQKPIKREFSESTSVSPSSSPDQDVYMFPSPVTPPDSDSSPPKPHSPSSTGTDLDDEASHKSSRDDLLLLDEPTPPIKPQVSPVRTIAKLTSKPITISPDKERLLKEKIAKFEKESEGTNRPDHSPRAHKMENDKKDGKKVRRKLPPIPVGEEPVLKPKAKIRGTKSTKQQPESKSRTAPTTAPKPTKHSTVSASDDSMNEEDMEVARITKHHVHKRKPISDVGKAKSLDVVAQVQKASKVRAEAQRLLRASSVGSSQKVGPKDETDAIIDSLISIYNIPITEAMKSLKRRLQEELRRVTRDRKRKIEELEEIRALQVQIGALQLDARHAARVKNGKRSPIAKQYEPPEQSRKRGGPSPSNASLTPRSSPQVTPRRQRHKRQSSDPMIAKFSPIKEDRDIESDFQSKLSDNSDQSRHSKYSTDDSSQSGLSDCDSSRSEPVSTARYKKIKPSAYARMFYKGAAGEPPIEHRDQLEPPSSQNQLSVSRSESHLTSGYRSDHRSDHRSGSGSGSRTPSYYSDEEIKAKEEKKAQLQYEIDKRKRQLEETTRLKHELLKLARARQALAHSYDDIPGRYGGDYPGQYRYAPQRPIPTGIIRPIDDEMDEVDVPVRRDGRQRRQRQHAYSSTEYLAHKNESRRYKSDEASIYSDDQHYSDGYSEVDVGSPPRHNIPPRMESSYPSATPCREARLSGSVTLPDMYHNRSDYEFIPTRDAFSAYSGSEGSPASDYTPAMPLLDDVMAKSRKIIRDIGSGSRPVSAEFNLDGGVEDLMNAMYRVESDNSVDADEPIMKHMTEGGVTILKQLDRKKKTPSRDPIKYPFPTKRILVTRDPKDRSVIGTTGNGLGMKIVGGKQVPGTKETGAYVTAIYSGGVADQLHGELEVGDQVLEWNGVPLSGKSYEDVQQIISQPNGEIEMVVRPLAFPSGSKKPGHSNSCHSSYDNLDLPYSDDELGEKARIEARSGVSPKGVDPQQLAAQLEEIREDVSPENSPSSSQHDFATPSVSSPCSTPLSDPTSTPSDKHQRLSHDKTASQSLAIQVAQQQQQQQNQQHHQGQGHSSQGQTGTSSSTRSGSHTSRTTHSTPSSQPNITSHPPTTSPTTTTRPTTTTQRTTSTQPTTSAHRAMVSPPSSSSSHSPSRINPGSHSPRPPRQSPNPGNLSTASSTTPSANSSDSNGEGTIQIQISHDDFDNILNIHVIQARNLKPRDLNGLSDPFVKIYLLPGRGAENKRRTKHIARTLNPEWHQTLIYPNLATEELKNKVLEITVWDYDRFKSNDFLGELIIELDEKAFLDNKPHWYPLRDHVIQQGFQLPKSSVPPPNSGGSSGGAEGGNSSSKNGKKGDNSKSPRHHRRHPAKGKKEDSNGGKLDQRRRSLDALDEASDQSRISPSRKGQRQSMSAHASPSPRRRTRDSRSPNKSRSSGSPFRW